MTKGKLSPFDIERSGTLFSEGAGALLISSSNENALARLRGWATNNNAFHLTAPSPEGDGSARVMQQALDCAGMEADEVDHINAHGTSTKHNDVTESQAIRKVFGAATDKILVTSNKSMLGHLMGAAGTVEAIASILTLRDQIIPPTINVTQQDPECCVNIVANTAIETEVANVLSNSAGIGGCNAAAIFGSVQ